MLYVLDASALLAVMQSEPGAEVVDALLEDQECVASSVNIAEVGTKLVDKGLPPEQFSRVLKQIDVQPIDFDAEQATACAALRAVTREYGLSLGDRACLALARGMQGVAVTADRAWGDLDAAAIGVRVQLIR
ncbi:type II toxin-antitoxin system VapC family toxin [Ottowia sp.]|uniref:type II toxin-antitoxin system VapC family toxin n=1 Tax=Ottowia sp. TaxID=1898956 RepID=UPI002BF0C2C8|nr:type II toxin-antitoxin system VapC family toxin [Ottowia sp.]HOB67520.1 type II toxin-antitoxin system VapC family toxin [Ottowia sp.]HPZ58223.1 type II toxin-antitoxin system VapC family toxin [Ottowia sp.]HQD48207.1 type II toxin-antitoxin system VapC family toxin [Ottowia sp.]